MHIAMFAKGGVGMWYGTYWGCVKCVLSILLDYEVLYFGWAMT